MAWWAQFGEISALAAIGFLDFESPELISKRASAMQKVLKLKMPVWQLWLFT